MDVDQSSVTVEMMSVVKKCLVLEGDCSDPKKKVKGKERIGDEKGMNLQSKKPRVEKEKNI